jgi:uncharacterized protein (TIGR02646 family)
MREIEGRPEPAALSAWRAAAQNDINFGYNLMPGELRAAVKAALVEEQRGLCAYTGIGIVSESSHIEHLNPQQHCERGEDVAYANLVACYPGPNDPYVPFGAHKKANWPTPAERHLFVSPRSRGCEARFLFNLLGAISAAADNDAAVEKTIRHLGLDQKVLTARRKAAIEGTLQLHPNRPASLDLKSARKRLTGLQQVEAEGTTRLEPFCFVLKQALRKHIRRLEAIKESKSRRR